MEGFLKSIFENIQDRLRNIFVSTFVLAWICWNWKYFYITFFVSEEYLNGFPDKFHYLKSIDTNSGILLWWPLITTACYILAIPSLNILTNSFLELCRREANNWKARISKETLFKQNEVAEFRKSDLKELKEKNDSIKELEERISKRDNTIEEITKQIIFLEEDNLKLKSNYDSLKKNSSETFFDIQTINKVLDNHQLIQNLGDYVDPLKIDIDEKILKENFSIAEQTVLYELKLLDNENDLIKINFAALKIFSVLINSFHNKIEKEIKSVDIDSSNLSFGESITKIGNNMVVKQGFSDEEKVDFLIFRKIFDSFQESQRIWFFKNMNTEPFEASEVVSMKELNMFVNQHKFIRLVKDNYAVFTDTYIQFINRFLKYYNIEK
ncbi:MAG: hypothetical protein WCX31_00220 [Salinivirgaceae bacterium]|jgi:hypothetical protein